MSIDLSNTIGILIRGIFIYFILLHSIYLVLIFIGLIEQKKHHDGIRFGEFKRISESYLTLPISIVVCAYNEELLILNTTKNLLNLRYPQHELIIVNDGSTDKTLELLITNFHLYETDIAYLQKIETVAPHSIYRSALYKNLTVIDKPNSGRADSNNIGANIAEYPILCQIDADCVLENDALIYMIRPFLYNSNVIAASGIIRPSNGLSVRNGKIIERQLPKSWLTLFQAIEYMRAFQWCRVGLAKLNSLIPMSGAYTFIRKDIFFKIGGANVKAIVDDFDLTVQVHRYIYDNKKSARMKIAFVPDPGCYTEIPGTPREFGRQRNFWQKAVIQSLLWNRDMLLNPKYGMVGFFGIPYFWIFEALSPIIEISAYLLIPISVYLGLADWNDIVMLFIFGVLMGSLVSVCAVLLQETTRMRQERTIDLVRLLFAGFFDHFGYHQLHLWHRLVGTYELLIKKDQTHKKVDRIGFN